MLSVFVERQCFSVVFASCPFIVKLLSFCCRFVSKTLRLPTLGHCVYCQGFWMGLIYELIVNNGVNIPSCLEYALASGIISMTWGLYGYERLETMEMISDELRK